MWHKDLEWRIIEAQTSKEGFLNAVSLGRKGEIQQYPWTKAHEKVLLLLALSVGTYNSCYDCVWSWTVFMKQADTVWRCALLRKDEREMRLGQRRQRSCSNVGPKRVVASSKKNVAHVGNDNMTNNTLYVLECVTYSCACEKSCVKWKMWMWWERSEMSRALQHTPHLCLRLTRLSLPRRQHYTLRT